MNHPKKIPQQGFALIALMIAIAIMAAMFALYYGKSGSNGQSVKQAGQKGIEQTKANNAAEIQQHLEIQNELNSIDQ